MNNPTSLSTFFEKPDVVSLDSCDREQIHLSGMIQNIGVLLVLDPSSERIIGASENAPQLLDIDMETLLSSTLSQVNTDLADQVRGADEDTHILHDVLEFGLEHDGIHYDTVTHLHSGRRILEFVPNRSPLASIARKNMRHCSKTSARVLHADTFEQSLGIATEAIKEISGCARVKIYRFLPDWSGEVIAESSNGKLPSYMGLCFPASDIPKQVRAIMSIIPYRAIGTTADDAVPIRTADGVDGSLDLTWSVLRSVSPMHTEYLRNIGVRTAFSSSLMHQDKLWGLIAAHDDTPGMLPFDSWSLLQEIGSAIMLRYDQAQRTDTTNMISGLRAIENQFSAALRLGGEVEDVLVNLVPVLRKYLGADGFAFLYGSRLHVSGKTPPANFIRDLIKWAIRQRETSDQFQSTKLHEQWAPAAEHMDTACGVLIQPIVVHRVCQLIWFRGPITKTIHWAGRPEGKQQGDRLGPRKSFETWVQEHREESAAWEASELESAREIFKEFLDIIAAQLLLKEENASLRQFAATAAHDLKAPLRGINMALRWMREDGFEIGAVKENHAKAEVSSRRLSELTDGLLELAVIQEQSHSFTQVDLTEIANDVAELLSTQISACDAHVEIHNLPTVVANQKLMIRLFLNVISNALKYHHPDRTPNLHISGKILNARLAEVYFIDNGIGIATKYANKIFLPMKRLHSKDKIEGSGLGLTICERILEIHGGKISVDTDRAEGTCFRVTLPLKQNIL